VTVVGVDGWRGRWVAAAADGRALTWTVHDTFAAVLTGHGGAAVVAVDMPIGVTHGPRESDTAARAWLREHGGTWSSIFLTPDAAAVDAWTRDRTHAQAMQERPAGTPGTSIQAWNLIPQIVQVRDALAAAPDRLVVEAHPECSLRRLDPSIGPVSKKTGLGVGRRLRALRRVFDLDLADAPADVPADDLLDAAAVAWTAARVERDDRDLLVLPEGATAWPRILI
jgi:predicted RNase H-like nuclease